MDNYVRQLTQYQAVELVGLAFPVCVLVLLAYRILSQPSSVTTAEYEKSSDLKTAYEVSESLPDPDPLHYLDLATKQTRNYLYVNKVVRWPYFQTMAHQPMDINDWVEVDKVGGIPYRYIDIMLKSKKQDYSWYISEKLRVVREEGNRAMDSLPENDAACGELLETLVDYLPKRFPTMFERLPDGIYNRVTGIRYENTSALTGVQALHIVAGLTQCDFLMARERDDGHVYFTGGIVAFPGFYLLSEKIGKSMEEVHAPVPEFNQKLLMSVERTLKRFKPNEPFERTSWEIVNDWGLFRHGLVDLPENSKLDMEPKDLLFRMDRQTFRKLPKTQAIIFGVHPLLKRLEEFADDPLVPALLARVHESGKRNLMDYKLAPMYQDRLMPYLAQLTQSQIDRGLIDGTEKVEDFRELLKDPRFR